MSETLKKPEPPVDDSKKKVKYGLLLMVAGAFVMVMDRTRLVAGVIIMGYAALQLLLYVVVSKRKYQKSYRQYEEDLLEYEKQEQKAREERQRLNKIMWEEQQRARENAVYIYQPATVSMESQSNTVEYDEDYDYADEDYDYVDEDEDRVVAKYKYDYDEEEEQRRLEEEAELADWLEEEQQDLEDYQHEMAYWCEVDEWMAKGGPESGEAPPQW